MTLSGRRKKEKKQLEPGQVPSRQKPQLSKLRELDSASVGILSVILSILEFTPETIYWIHP